jgi:hypothetical protein
MDQDVASNAGEPVSDILLQLVPGSKRLVIAFGGLRHMIGMSPFEFLQSLGEVGLNRTFVRDNHQAWYHRGVDGIAGDIDSVADHLRELTSGMEAVFTIGNSAGGFGALLFGALLSCEVHAFSPQTFIDPELRKAHGDIRWTRLVNALGDDMDPRYADLRPVIAESEATCHVYYPTQVHQDVVHAEHLDGLRQVTLHPFDSDDHSLIRQLRDSGWLDGLLRRIADPESA